ncbi:hypothetical protein FGG08_003323 [Glutinoglossum americanum]|uniref:CipC-like antibiotic response protein n=1 Tax=Glutinoglossum americanum TaxID=1670608 RepID=A0A9P8KY97_9PEZI|nr:hypothetical protein FGG08_003323 [Glutinoglossum americanum]
MVFGWGESHDAHQEVYDQDGPKHEAKFSHELIAGAAAFEGFKLFEDHQRKQGKPVSHAFAKELLAGFAAGEVDKLIETKGRDYYDAEQAKHQAKRNAEHMYDQHYVQHHGAEEYNPNQYGPPPRINEQYGN